MSQGSCQLLLTHECVPGEIDLARISPTSPSGTPVPVPSVTRHRMSPDVTPPRSRLVTAFLPASWALDLHEALTGLGEGDHVIVDGSVIPIDRIRTDEPPYSMKHRPHGINLQVVARPDGTPLWFFRATPGCTHDLTAARAHGIVQACLTRQILVLADRGLPVRRRRRPHPLPPPRTARALPAVQPRPRPAQSPG